MNPTGDQSVRNYDQSYTSQYTSGWTNGLVQGTQTSGHVEHVGVSGGPVQPPYPDPGPLYSEFEASNNGFLGALHGEYPPPPPAYQQPQTYDHMTGDMFHSGHIQSEPQITQHPHYQNCSFQNPVTDESLSSLLQTDPSAGGQTTGPPAVHLGHPIHVPVPQVPQTGDSAPGVHSGYQGDIYYDPYSQNPVHYPDNGHYQTSGIHTTWSENHNYYHNNYYYNDHNYHNQFYQGYQEYNQNPEVINREIPKRTFDCKMCDQKFSFKYELERHLKRKDHLNTKDFKCKICNQGFTMEYNLSRHYNMVHKRSIDENPVIPGLPQITTVMRENRNTRKISDLVTGLIETFECSNCHETFSKYDDYRSHMASQHTDSKKYICPHRTCSNHFEHLDMLLDHVKKHNNIIKKTRSTKRLRCSDCNKEFTRPDALKRHWKIHEKNKRIPCPFNKHTKCQRTFYRMDDLKRHLENHKNPKFVIPSFTCDQCSKIFRNQTDLDEHKKIHVSKKFRVTCQLCGKGFKNEHARRVHKCPAKKKKKQNYKNGAKKGWEARKARLKSNENNLEERDLEDEDDIEDSNLIIDET